MRLEGLHHISAITGSARRNVDFYTRVLGLRLTAKSVNQDHPAAYHLFYGDERAQAGADLTFFEYPYARPGRPGAGMVHRIVSRVRSPQALDFWRARLDAEGIPTRSSIASLCFDDPEGLSHELVVDRSDDAPLIARHPEIPPEVAMLGFDGVRAYSADAEATVEILERPMGAATDAAGRFELRGLRRGGWIALDPVPPAPGRSGAGTVHHVAWSTTNADQDAWLERLEDAGIPHSGILDRYYFHSLYFREPGGLLFELATEEPGFTLDTTIEELGRRLVLPPWLESRRAEMEAGLTPLADPRALWPAPST